MMTMRTRTEEYGTYPGIQDINNMEEQGWAVRQIVPVVESASSQENITFYTKIWVVFEREDSSGWVMGGNPV